MLFSGALAGLALAGAADTARAAIAYAVSFDDPGGRYAAYYPAIRSNLQAAGAAWSKYIISDASIEIAVRFANIPTASGYSATSAFVRSNGPYNVFEQGVAAELRSRIDPNGAAPDAIVNIGTSYLANDLWFDPNPYARTAPVPSGKTDAQSAFLHEFGHIFAMNGWRDPVTGALPGNYESTFDALVTSRNGNLYFTGAEAVGVYGGPVPLTLGNYQHFGNDRWRQGGFLLDDLMNGVRFYTGTRYAISPLDVAVLRDVGMSPTADAVASGPPVKRPAVPDPTPVPEPSGLLALGVGLALLAMRRMTASPRA